MTLKEDRFSIDGPIWQEVQIKNSKEFEEVVNIFEKLNLIDKKVFFRIYHLKGLEINSSNLMVQSNFKNFVAKKYNVSDASFLNSQVDLYKFIKKKKLSGPYILDGHMPESFIKKNVDMLFLEYKKGQYYKGSFADMKKAASSISNFIKEFQSFDSSKLQEIEILQKNSKDIFEDFELQKNSWSLKFGNETAHLLKSEWGYIKECLNNSSKEIVKIKKAKKFALHIDLHPHNLLIHKDECTILDIDSIRLCHWPSAVGFTIFKLLRQSLTHLSYDRKFEQNAKKFITTVTESINKEGIPGDVLFIGARLEILRRLLIILEGNLGEKISPWNSVLEIQMNALKEVNLLRELMLE
tara:strand:+ start:1038 stop:2096 length:1059 start_codon:yes stop_codon:yes gene_type:complete